MAAIIVGESGRRDGRDQHREKRAGRRAGLASVPERLSSESLVVDSVH